MNYKRVAPILGIILSIGYISFFAWLISTLPAGRGPGIIIIPLLFLLIYCITILVRSIKDIWKWKIDNQNSI
jgi:hypothetical protein